MFDRFYAFGCSFTQYIWPTWADIVATDLGIPFENWGRGGAGNQFIAAKIIECDTINTLTPNDLVVVMWSGWSREDRFLDTSWKTVGSVFNNHVYDFNFIEKYWSLNNDDIKNSVAIQLVRRAYKDIIKFHASMTEPGAGFEGGTPDLYNEPTAAEIRVREEVKRIYADNIGPVEVFKQKHQSHSFNGKCNDAHPDVLSHMAFVTDQLYPVLGYTLKQSTIDLYTRYQRRIEEVLSPFDSRADSTKKILLVNAEFGFDLVSYKGL